MTQAAILASNGGLMTAPSGTAPAYQCRAWVNFNGTGTVAIRASGNVSSITDNSTGNYTVNFTTAMPDANYSAQCTSANNAGSSWASYLFDSASATTGSVRVVSSNQTGTGDSPIYSVAIFR